MSHDLHSHTVFSDGLTTPAQNARLASAAGLAGLAITDHDTVEHFDAAQAACHEEGLEWVPGLELSCERDGFSVHLLALWVDPGDHALTTELARLRGERERRIKAMIGHLAEAGIVIAFEDVVARAGGAPLGRPHLAAALVASGTVADHDEAFAQWLGDGAAAYEPKRALTPERGVALIRQAGGVAVLAHPGLSDRAAVDLQLLEALAAAGLAGVEADHPGHEFDEVTRWTAAARERGLVVTGGSDFHGTPGGVHVGACSTSLRSFEALTARRPS